MHAEGLDHFAVLDHLDGLAHLTNDPARVAADKGIAPDVLASFDGFKQERLALPANLAIGRERRLDVRQQPAGDGDQVALGRQTEELFEGGRVHAG